MEWVKDFWHEIELFFGAIIALFSWFVKDAIKTIQEKIASANALAQENHRLINQVKLDYVLKTDFKEFREELWNRLDRLEDIMRKTKE